MATIEIRNLGKRFDRTEALRDVSLTLLPGKIYGLLGRNGAGKTTLLNLITNKLFPDAGEVLIDGETAVENDRAQAKIFHVSDGNLYPPELRIGEAFKWTREFYPSFAMDYARELAGKFTLDPGKRVKALSTGYHSIFKLILALASGAPVLLFDEPVLGLDANYRELFYRELIAVYSAHPKTVVVSTHLIGEVAHVLEEVVIIKDGGIILSQPVEEVLALAYMISGEAAKVDAYTAGKNVIREERMGRFKAATIYQRRESADLEAIRALGLEVARAGLQDLFISLTSK
ncbi:MAG: ATP-binding cassette domain-containing protein [Bacteroidota bacterium]